MFVESVYYVVQVEAEKLNHLIDIHFAWNGVFPDIFIELAFRKGA